MAASISAASPAIEVGEVRRLFQVNARRTAFAGYLGYDYDVSADPPTQTRERFDRLERSERSERSER